MTVDAGGNVLVVGSDIPGSWGEAWIRKHDPDGALLWEAADRPEYGVPHYADIEVLTDGGVLLAGSTYEEPPFAPGRPILVRLTTDGEHVWSRLEKIGDEDRTWCTPLDERSRPR